MNPTDPPTQEFNPDQTDPEGSPASETPVEQTTPTLPEEPTTDQPQPTPEEQSAGEVQDPNEYAQTTPTPPEEPPTDQPQPTPEEQSATESQYSYASPDSITMAINSGNALLPPTQGGEEGNY